MGKRERIAGREKYRPLTLILSRGERREIWGEKIAHRLPLVPKRSGILGQPRKPNFNVKAKIMNI